MRAITFIACVFAFGGCVSHVPPNCDAKNENIYTIECSDKRVLFIVGSECEYLDADCDAINAAE